MKRPAIVVAGILLAVGAFARAGDSSSGNGSDVLELAFSAEVRSLDPAKCFVTVSTQLLGHFYEGLYAYDYLKRPTCIRPLIAAKMPEVSEDGLTYTISIAKGVTYAPNPCFESEDGGESKRRTVKADDFILAFKRSADSHVDASASWGFLAERVKGLDDWRRKSKDYAPRDLSRYDLPVEGLKAPDDLTLQIQLTRRFPQFVHILTLLNMAPVPREAVDFWFAGRRRKWTDKNKPPVFGYSDGCLHLPSTGPYILKTYAVGAPIVMVRNPSFRKDRYPTAGAPGDKESGLLADAGKVVPFIREIRWHYVQDSLRERFLAGKIAMMGLSRSMQTDFVTQEMRLKAKWKEAGLVLEKHPFPVVYWFDFNQKDPVLGASKALRQAMCLAYDVEAHIRTLYPGRAVRAMTFVPASLFGRRLAPSPYAKFDLQAARKKLEQAKKELAAKRLLVDGEIPMIRLDLPGKDPHFMRQGQFARKQFLQIGLNVKPVYNDWVSYRQKLRVSKAQLSSIGWAADYPDPQNFLQIYYSPNIDKGLNSSNYSNPAFDKLYAKASTMPASKKRTDLYVRMLQILNEDCPALLLCEPVGLVLRWRWLKNSKSHPFGYGFARFLRIDAELRSKLHPRRPEEKVKSKRGT